MNEDTIATITDLNILPDALGEEWQQGERLFFRGQPQDWPLIPSLGRQYNGVSLIDKEKELFDKFKKEYIQRFFIAVAAARPKTQKS